MKHREINFRLSLPQPDLRFHWRGWLPTRGNVIFTLAMIALLVLAQSVGALPLPATFRAPEAASTGTIAYQGRLADAAGAPINSKVGMTFRLYEAAEAGTPLWTEPWIGTNEVNVSDGLFNVMLGSLTPLQQSAIAGHSQLYLGISVGNDDEMRPRVQLGSVPFAVQALTVPDGSVTTGKIADGAVTQAKAPSLLQASANNQRLERGRVELTLQPGWQTSIATTTYNTPFASSPNIAIANVADNAADNLLNIALNVTANGIVWNAWSGHSSGSRNVAFDWIAVGQ